MEAERSIDFIVKFEVFVFLVQAFNETTKKLFQISLTCLRSSESHSINQLPIV